MSGGKGGISRKGEKASLRNFYLESLKSKEQTGKRDPEGGLVGEERWLVLEKRKKGGLFRESKRRGGKS